MAALAADVPPGVSKRQPGPINGYNAAQGRIGLGLNSMRTAPVLGSVVASPLN